MSLRLKNQVQTESERIKGKDEGGGMRDVTLMDFAQQITLSNAWDKASTRHPSSFIPHPSEVPHL